MVAWDGWIDVTSRKTRVTFYRRPSGTVCFRRPLFCCPNLKLKIFAPFCRWLQVARTRIQPSQPTVVNYLKVPTTWSMEQA